MKYLPISISSLFFTIIIASLSGCATEAELAAAQIKEEPEYLTGSNIPKKSGQSGALASSVRQADKNDIQINNSVNPNRKINP